MTRNERDNDQESYVAVVVELISDRTCPLI